jgi:hypothetical protein
MSSYRLGSRYTLPVVAARRSLGSLRTVGHHSVCCYCGMVDWEFEARWDSRWVTSEVLEGLGRFGWSSVPCCLRHSYHARSSVCSYMTSSAVAGRSASSQMLRQASSPARTSSVGQFLERRRNWHGTVEGWQLGTGWGCSKACDSLATLSQD